MDKSTLEKADRVTKKLGTSTSEMVRVFVTEIARTGKVPVNLGKNADEDLLDVKRRNQILANLDDATGW